MKLEYSVSLEDIVAFNNHHMESTPTLRRKLSVMRFVWAFAPLIGILLISSIEGMSSGKAMLVIAAVAIFISSPIYLLQPMFLRWLNTRQVRKVYSNPQNQALLGPREIKIVSNGLVEKTTSGQVETDASQVDRIETTKDYIFIYAGSRIHIVSKKTVQSGDPEAFLSELRKKAKNLEEN